MSAGTELGGSVLAVTRDGCWTDTGLSVQPEKNNTAEGILYITREVGLPISGGFQEQPKIQFGIYFELWRSDRLG